MAGSEADFRLHAVQQAPIPVHARLHCRGGELLALVGPSGSGKSTLLRMAAGLARPAAGRITCGAACWFDSAAGIHLAPQRRHVGYVPQHYGLFPHLGALDNVRAGLGHLPAPQQEAQAALWLDRMGLAALHRRRPGALSGGQQQRVALARALARDPAVLLLDEPFAAVDRVTRDALYLELAALKRHLAIPMVMVTHDLDEALQLGDRLTLLAPGGVTVQSGAPREVMAHPVNEVAAAMVGAVNLLEVTVQAHETARRLTWVDAGALRLALAITPQWPPGSRMLCMVPNQAVRLRAISRSDLPAGPNRVRLEICAWLALGDEVRLTARLPGVAQPLALQVPARLAAELGLRVGARTEAVLREDRLHLLLPGVARRAEDDAGARPPADGDAAVTTRLGEDGRAR